MGRRTARAKSKVAKDFHRTDAPIDRSDWLWLSAADRHGIQNSRRLRSEPGESRGGEMIVC